MKLMVTSLNCYEVYKDVGIKYLPSIPESWSLKKAKFITKIYAGLTGKSGNDFSKESIPNFTKFIPFTSIYNTYKVKDIYQYVRSSSFEVQNIVNKNDILFLMSSETIEDIAACSIYKEEDSVYLNSFCKGLRVVNTQILLADYLNYLLKSSFYRIYFMQASRGFTRINLKQEYITNVLLVLPSLYEQTSITDFLDKKIDQIDKAITIKEQQIIRLKEYQQITIQKTVIQGLNPNVPMKDSGIEWIGKIPEHWETKPGFTIFSENKILNKEMKENTILSLSYGKIVIKPEEKLTGLVPESFSTYQVIKPSDIIIRCTDLQNDKTSLRTGISKYNGIITNAYLCLCAKTGSNNSSYLHYFLHVLDITKVIYMLGSGLRQNLSFQDFKHMLILIPPKSEQNKIVDFIEQKLFEIRKTIELQQLQIEKLREYKTTLINSAVMGKIKVV